MEDNNIKWEPGDVAICINVGNLPSKSDPNGINPPLRLKAEYIVNDVNICGDCGTVKLDVGLASQSDNGTTCGCGAKSRPNTHIHWANAIRFIKKRTRSEVESELEKAVNDEEFKHAQMLQDELNNLKP